MENNLGELILIAFKTYYLYYSNQESMLLTKQWTQRSNEQSPEIDPHIWFSIKIQRQVNGGQSVQQMMLEQLDIHMPKDVLQSHHIQKLTQDGGGASRWQKSKTWRSPSSPQIHEKYIYMWNSSCRTLAEDLKTPKKKETPHGSTWVG